MPHSHGAKWRFRCIVIRSGPVEGFTRLLHAVALEVRLSQSQWRLAFRQTLAGTKGHSLDTVGTEHPMSWHRP